MRKQHHVFEVHTACGDALQDPFDRIDRGRYLRNVHPAGRLVHDADVGERTAYIAGDAHGAGMAAACSCERTDQVIRHR